jgi:predicted metalloprotease
MTKSGTIKLWVAAMLITAFVAGGTTFLFLGQLFGQVPEPGTQKMKEFRRQWIETFDLSSDQIRKMDQILQNYEAEWSKLLDEMHRKYRPQFQKLSNSVQKDLDAMLTLEQQEILRRQREERRARAEPAPEGR